MKRKSSISKEDITIKSEPQSPSVGNSQLDLNGFEDSVIGPPPEKTVKLESPVTEGIKTNKSGFGVTVEVQTNNEKDCKETQTVGKLFPPIALFSSIDVGTRGKGGTGGTCNPTFRKLLGKVPLKKLPVFVYEGAPQ